MNESVDSVRILHANRNAKPPIFNAILVYKDGTKNYDAALHISNVVGLAEAGVKIYYDQDCNTEDIPKDELAQVEAGKQRYLDYLEALEKEKANKNKPSSA